MCRRAPGGSGPRRVVGLAPDGLELGLVLEVEVGVEVDRGVRLHRLLRGAEAPLADEELGAEGGERLSQLIQFGGCVVIQWSR